jgi:hypothetical protein
MRAILLIDVIVAVLIILGSVAAINRDRPGHRLDAFTVAAQMRGLPAFLPQPAGLAAILGAVEFWQMRNPRARTGWRAAYHRAGVAWTTAFTLLAVAPTLLLLVYAREAYAPLDVGGVPDPISPAVFGVLKTAWHYSSIATMVALPLWIALSERGGYRRRVRLTAQGVPCATSAPTT